MSERTDNERDLAEEDDVRALLRHGERDLLPPTFASVEHAAQAPVRSPGFAAGAVAALALVLVLVFVTSAGNPPAGPGTPAPTGSPQATVGQVATSPRPDTSLCPDPPRPGYLPWLSSSTQLQTTPTSKEMTFFGPDRQSWVRIELAPYRDGAPGRRQTVGGRDINVYITPAMWGPFVVPPGQTPSASLASGAPQRPSEVRATWREVSGSCPMVTVALVWPGEEARHESELLRIVASIPPLVSSSTPAPAASDNYGLLVRHPDGKASVVRESDGAAVATLTEPSTVFAPSPNGAEVAYFGGADGDELWLARARDLGGRTKLLTLRDERGTGIVWSPDGTSLMIGAASKTLQGPAPHPAPAYTALRTLARDGSGLRELARIANGQSVRPLAWDPGRDIGAAEEGLGQKGAGRYVIASHDRILVEGSGVSSKIRYIDLPEARDANVIVDALRASPDARFVMGTWYYGGQRSVVRFWPLEGSDFGRTRELVPENPGEVLRGAHWRPGTVEIVANVAGNLQIWTLDGQRRSVRNLGGSAVFLSVRYDGSAVYSAPAGNGRLTVIELSPPHTTRDIRLDGLEGVLHSVRLSEP